MNSFIQKKLPSGKNLSAIIRAERLSRQLSLEQVALETAITFKYLKALEEGNYNLLPGEVYVKQFIKKLSDFFKLNQQFLIKIYQEEKQNQDLLIKVASSIPKNYLRKNFFDPKMINRIVIGCLIIIFIGYIAWEVKNIFTPPVLTIAAPVNQSVTTESSITIKGQTEPETTVLINNQEILTQSDGSFSQSVDLTIGLNVFKISASKKRSQAATMDISILRQGAR